MWVEDNFYNGEVVDLLSWKVSKDEEASTEQEIYYNKMEAEPYPTASRNISFTPIFCEHFWLTEHLHLWGIFFPLEFMEISRVN